MLKVEIKFGNQWQKVKVATSKDEAQKVARSIAMQYPSRAVRVMAC